MKPLTLSHTGQLWAARAGGTMLVCKEQELSTLPAPPPKLGIDSREQEMNKQRMLAEPERTERSLKRANISFHAVDEPPGGF